MKIFGLVTGVAVCLFCTPACHQQIVPNQTMTDCHDGTFCPQAYPVCVNLMSDGNHCEAADHIDTTWGLKRSHDAGAD